MSMGCGGTWPGLVPGCAPRQLGDHGQVLSSHLSLGLSSVRTLSAVSWDTGRSSWWRGLGQAEERPSEHVGAAALCVLWPRLSSRLLCRWLHPLHETVRGAPRTSASPGCAPHPHLCPLTFSPGGLLNVAHLWSSPSHHHGLFRLSADAPSCPCWIPHPSGTAHLFRPPYPTGQPFSLPSSRPQSAPHSGLTQSPSTQMARHTVSPGGAGDGG